MRYREVIEGRFIDRPNRFIAHVLINGVEETVHVKNTGRCRELLLPNAEVRLAVSDNPNRKTKCDLVDANLYSDEEQDFIKLVCERRGWEYEEN